MSPLVQTVILRLKTTCEMRVFNALPPSSSISVENANYGQETTRAALKSIKNNNHKKMASSLLNDLSSPLSIISRKRSYNRSRTSINITTISTPLMKFANNNSTSRSKSSFPVLLAVIPLSMTLLPISSCLPETYEVILTGEILFNYIGCKGRFDSSLFQKLVHLCEDCYDIFRYDDVYHGCRDNCFTKEIFPNCVKGLLKDDELEDFKEAIKHLHGAEPSI